MVSDLDQDAAPASPLCGVLAHLAQSDRRALGNLALIAETSPEAMAAALLEAHLRALRAEHQGLDGTRPAQLAALARRIQGRGQA